MVRRRSAWSSTADVPRGFTLLEAVVAMTIIGVVSVAALAAFGADLRAAERAQRMLPAAALAQDGLAALEQLTIGPLAPLPDSLARGRFDPPFEGYSWTATAKRVRPIDQVVELSITVSWATGSFTLTERRYDP
jgi:prepilin-type N-terminal cleavage/methylation domain-containing protein